MMDELKKQAAIAALDAVKNGMIVGLGTGSTASHFIRELGVRVKQGLRVHGIPTSEESRRLAAEVGVPLTTLAEHPSLDVTVDGADEVSDSLDLIKGLGGALVRVLVEAPFAASDRRRLPPRQRDHRGRSSRRRRDRPRACVGRSGSAVPQRRAGRARGRRREASVARRARGCDEPVSHSARGARRPRRRCAHGLRPRPLRVLGRAAGVLPESRRRRGRRLRGRVRAFELGGGEGTHSCSARTGSGTGLRSNMTVAMSTPETPSTSA